ncbi:[Fe-Fe] hydrogenase large subunit C-terminal domain-containing protein [Desulforamulus hydrothermalis]|uniref:Hydrogenase large subunit domain protein n=1 Tax=Desulforamulus hydrothermalis Lam5 = DSM 18033 TaxID=1121428 RepID=K8DXN9_9FIRM|nr:[Fe-Fe] hydrogenase large subunit C-terminal domain-containing protein [Desulforamulus hydrothermalis]CCO07345.1 Hydrogenase large subunit domain protein [Desulforamulus hydrothermalis Lam5 = DSM 18033]SHG94539.1 Iron only hydrogenase large subunit, C-terminal domain [Desulforamulus hydrothermalis Lam5 = DSM 18033]
MTKLTYDQIFKDLVKSAYDGKLDEGIAKLKKQGDGDVEKYIQYAVGGGDPDRVVYKVRDCSCGCEDEGCQVSCLMGAIERDEQGHVVIRGSHCTDCGQCVEVCQHDCLVDRKEFIPLVEILKNRKVPVYAIIAPAFIGQFGEEVSPGQLRAALKRLGFYGMVEVALFADILTFREALEFDAHVQKSGDFVLTSMCCPMWVSMVKKVYTRLSSHITPSVSPMVACGRSVKKLHPDAKVVFIGPCIAKKAEAKEPDVRDAVDVVITFKELQQIFEAVGIDPAAMVADEKEHSSTGGRIYARTGGVSKAVADTLKRIRPDKQIQIKAVQAHGVKECKQLLQDALDGKIIANFYEGMGCVGGCVGGPHVLIDPARGTELVNRYGEQANSLTPADNKYVLALLKKLGFEEIDDLFDEEKARMFSRSFL